MTRLNDVTNVCIRLTLFLFVTLGRGPSFINKFPGLTYSIGTLIAFTFGIGDTGRCVVNGVLALDNSPLADHYRKAVKKR